MSIATKAEDVIVWAVILGGGYVAYKAYAGAKDIVKTISDALPPAIKNSDGSFNLGATVANVVGLPMSDKTGLPIISQEQFLAVSLSDATQQPLVYQQWQDPNSGEIAVVGNALGDVDAQTTIANIANYVGVPISRHWYGTVDVPTTAAAIFAVIMMYDSAK